MAFLSTNASARGMAVSLNQIEHGKWCEGFFEFGGSPTVAVNDMIDFFDQAVFQSYYVGDWYIKGDQLDTGATPALVVHVGYGDAIGGVSATPGYRWASNRLVGGTAAEGFCIRDEGFGSHRQTGPNQRLGMSIVTLPSVAAFANKRIRFGILPLLLTHSK